MNVIKKAAGYIFLAILVIVVGLGAIYLFTGGVMLYDVIKDQVTWKDATTPLSQEVITDLCTQLEIDTTDARCVIDNSSMVYGPDFFKDIYKVFTPDDSSWATYDEVEEIIGTYKYKCEPTVQLSDGTEYFVCAYDFAGDRVFPIAIFYFSNGNIMKLIANVSD